MILNILPILLLINLNCCHAARIARFFMNPEIKGDFNTTAHFSFQHVKKYCNETNRRAICASNATRICAVRREGQGRRMERRNFENACYLFLSNMCDHPGKEFYIVWDSDCDNYLARRRHELDQVVTEAANVGAEENAEVGAENVDPETKDAEAGADNTEAGTENTEAGAENIEAGTEATDVVAEHAEAGAGNVDPEAKDAEPGADYVASDSPDGAAEPEAAAADAEAANDTNANSSAAGLRSGADSFVPLYGVDWAFDGHICPLSCLETYNPICVTLNRGHHKYMKIFTFVNHCLGDLYYCKNHEEFKPPPGYDDEVVVASPLSWSYCAASRYISFARFSEVASSMGHFGWLAGDYSARHILEPHERVPGYGRR